MTLYGRSVLRAILLIFFCQGVPANSQQVIIDIDLNSGAFKTTAPFDEPFRIRGPASAQLLEVHATYCKLDNDSKPDSCNTCNETIRPWIRGPLFTGDSFYLDVNWLDANANYQFCFSFLRKMTDQELSAYRGTVSSALDNALRKITPDNDFVPLLPDSIGRIIIGVIKSSLPDATYQLDINKVLPEKGPGLELSTPFNRIMELQYDRLNHIETFKLGLDMSVPRLGRFEDDSTLLRVRTYYDSVDENKINKDDKEPIQDGFVLTTYNAFSRAKIASGMMPLNGSDGSAGLDPTMISVPDVWLPAEISTRITNLKTTHNKLSKLRAMLLKLKGNTKLLKEMNVSTVAIAEQGRNIDEALSAIDISVVALEDLSVEMTERQTLLSEQASKLEPRLLHSTMLSGTTVGEFATRANWYVAADIGLAVAPDIDEALPYVGTNIYFRPVNKNTPLSLIDSWDRRLSLTIGLTFSSIEIPNRRDDLFLKFGVLTGVGIRVSDAFRIAGGVLLLRARNNPFLDDYQFGITGYGSLSFDWDIRSTFAEPWKAVYQP